jgi:ABC-2 type transport system ATP-binding protein
MIAAAPAPASAVLPAPAAPAAAAAPMPMVEVRALTRSFPVRRGWRETLRHPRAGTRATVVDRVTLRVGRGELFGVLGPNGAGKTTLFKMLSTLVLPESGSATVDGADLVREAARVRRVMAPVGADERSLMWRISARENLRLYGALHGLRGHVLADRVAELLEVVELADAADRIVAGFSSGMRQRLLIARALLSRPRVLLLDEPTRSLDPVSARRFRAFLRDTVVGASGCTVLLATHDAEEALELCDRVGVLNRGRLLAVGTPADLARPAGAERYRLRTRVPLHPALAPLRPRPGTDRGGWTTVEVEIAGGEDAVADAVATLARCGVPVAGVEPVRLALAELIEQVVREAEP